MRRRSANDACGDATPSNKPLEWTGHHEFTSGARCSLPATQGQRWLHQIPMLGRLEEVSLRVVPTVLRSGPYRVYFHSHEPNEPPHVHVDRDRASCKMWLNPVALASSLGFKPAELRDIERLVSDNRAMLVKAWEEFHG